MKINDILKKAMDLDECQSDDWAYGYVNGYLQKEHEQKQLILTDVVKPFYCYLETDKKCEKQCSYCLHIEGSE